jgi:hypothetical protein
MGKVNLGKAAFAKVNNTNLNIDTVYEKSRKRFENMAVSLGVGFGVTDNVAYNNTDTRLDTLEGTVADLQSSKEDTITGFSGSLEVITGIDFENKTTTTSTVTFDNGIVTGVV